MKEVYLSNDFLRARACVNIHKVWSIDVKWVIEPFIWVDWVTTPFGQG